VAVRASAAAFVALATLIAGCGGGHALTKSEYAARANALCRQFKQAAAKVPFSDPSTRKGRKDIEKLNAEATKLAADLRALRPPGSLKAARDRWFRELDLQLEETQRLTHGRIDVTLTEAQARKLKRYYRAEDAAARQLGATACVSGE
jgi:hypothetical protein